MLKIRKAKGGQKHELAKGVGFIYREATTVDREAAQIAARRFFARVRDGEAALADYGLGAGGAAELEADKELTVGVSYIVSMTELVMRCVSEWHGFGDEEGNALPLDRVSIALALQDQAIYDAFSDRLYATLHSLDAEGNASAPSQNGDAGAANATAEIAAE